MVSNESETDSNPRKRQGTLLSFFTNPIIKKSKADTKVKKPYDRNDTRKTKNEWFKQFELLQLDNDLASDCSTYCIVNKLIHLLIFVGSKLNKVLHNFK
jgi:hypothetical protein